MHHPTKDSTYHSLCYTSCGAVAGTRVMSSCPKVLYLSPFLQLINIWELFSFLCEVWIMKSMAELIIITENDMIYTLNWK